ncbi:MAG: hypothetical protein ACJ0DH_10130 [bacterium]
MIVGFDYTITGHAYNCTDCPEVSPVYLSQNYSVTTFAGNGESGSSNGNSSVSSFNSPINLALDSNNNIFIADFGNSGIRKIDPSGNVTNLWMILMQELLYANNLLTYKVSYYKLLG